MRLSRGLMTTVFSVGVFFSLGLFSVVPSAQAEVRVNQKYRALDQLSQVAKTVVLATCTRVESTYLDKSGQEASDGRQATKYQFSVEKVYRGDAGDVADGTLEIFRPGWITPKEGARTWMGPIGISFKEGATYLLFLNGKSSWGFTAPVAEGLGTFKVVEKNGERLLANQVGNQDLVNTRALSQLRTRVSARTLDSLEENKGPIDLASFETLLEAVR